MVSHRQWVLRTNQKESGPRGVAVTQNRMFEFRVSFCPRFAKGFFAKGCTTQAVFNCCSKQKSKHNLKLAGSHRMWSDLQNQLNQVHPDQERWCLPKCRVLHRPASLNLILELQTQKFLSATQKCESDIFTAKVKVSVYQRQLKIAIHNQNQ